MLVKIALVVLFGALAVWMCNMGLKRTARTPQGMVLDGPREEATCPRCGGPSSAPDTPCPSCRRP